MSTLLHIDTAIQLGSICISNDDKSLGVKVNSSQSDHAAWLQPAIRSLLHEHNIELNNLDAIAVSAGPGSYTGLRVSMATAKGLCYVLQKPLILVGTLKMMAVSALKIEAEFFCPMIDARRMEVFTAVYDSHLNELVKPHNCILPECNFLNLLDEGRVVFFGNGSSKLKPLVSHQNAIFKELETTAEQMVGLAYQSMKKNEFANLAYSEPLYGKEFFSPAFKKNNWYIGVNTNNIDLEQSMYIFVSPVKRVSMINETIETSPAVNAELKIDVIQLKKAALILRAVNHKLRQQILKLIHQHERMTVTEIYVKLRLEQSVASQHLAILRKAGFVSTLRDGKFIYYSVNHPRLEQVHHFVHELLK